MKLSLLLSSAGLLATLSVFGAPAASDTPSAGPTTPPVAAPAPAAPMHMGMSITPDELATLRAAVQKARQDPAVQAADQKRKDALKALHAAMVAHDKSLAPLIDKIETTGTSLPSTRLTPEEQGQMRAGFQGIQTSPEALAWRQSNIDFRDALNKAMIAADPSVAPIIAKLSQGHMGMGRPAGNGPALVAPPATPAPAPSATP